MKRGDGLYKFGKESLIEIIFGAKTPEFNRNEIKKLISKFKYNKTLFRNAKISESEFKLEIE